MQPGSRLHGVYAAELRLPHGSTLGLLARAGSTYALQPDHPAAHRRRPAGLHRAGATGHGREADPRASTAPVGWRTGTATPASRTAVRDDRGVRPTLAETLDLEPHPEGGWYRQTWVSPETAALPDGRVRPTATLIHFLLPAGESSAWHRVASDELWLAHTGAVTLEYGGTRGAAGRGGGGDRRRPARRRAAAQALVPAGVWQRTLPGRRGCAGQLPGLAGLRLRRLRAGRGGLR